ncbi:hypothetical protein MSAN_00997900 [Mycena sanguinolenta]|uniref:Uncharacterized protein n=1 Tax=Mycena sanguinolenta TaxID=230812 RepID=A0A8H6YQQ9_9AGAR|nr:hypothetical protein MSAN_00997900 [Mycena sanguinolenta]
MFRPALSQLLSRPSCRCFSRAGVLNAAPRPPLHPRPSISTYEGITIGTPAHPRPGQEQVSSNAWTYHPVADLIAENAKQKTPEEKWRAHSLTTVARLQKHPIADPYSGRCVQVVSGKFAEAVRDFERILARNSVRSTNRAAERHEKKGVKRRRIRSQQWRKHFANQVRKNVQLVHKIRRRGA